VSQWRGIWAVFAGGLVAGAYMTKVPPALPQLRAELGLSLVESTFIVTTFNVLGMLVGVLAGMLSDRFGRKRLALAGLVLMAVGGAVGRCPARWRGPATHRPRVADTPTIASYRPPLASSQADR